MKNTLLTLLMLLFTIIEIVAQSPVLHLTYDEANGTSNTIDAVNATSFFIPNIFGKPERIPGVYGNALRTDGFSTWADGPFTQSPGSQFTAETWIALESYPSDEETIYPNLTPSGIISQVAGDLGFQIGVNTFGVYWFSANINGQKYTCQAPSPFPKYEWVHVAGVIDGNNGVMRLYLNGQQMASTSIPAGGQLHIAANAPLLIGKNNYNKFMGIFLVNALNAAIDETKIYAHARSQQSLQAEYQNGMANVATTGMEAIAVHPDRFNHDLQRPRFHGMPPANWTNEPHGLVYHNGKYHMFYQRTPNGPFKTMMHWGHMISTDLVHWENTKDALWPTLEWSATSGYDMKGIWSGDVVIDNGVAHAFYTNVNHTGPFNPGIALATSSDNNFQHWTKHGPLIDRLHVDDFRDPYLWKDGNTWKMIIGAKVNGVGGLDFYTSSDLVNWNRQSQFTSVPYSQMDTGSEIWEMPVFESIGNGKHILIVNPIGGSATKYGPNYTRGVYWTGTWNNNVFTPDYVQPKFLDVIHGHLSPTVTRKPDGQLVGIGIVDERWSSQAQLDAGWCHTFSLPRVYSLMPDNQTLAQSPSPELQSLRVPGSHSAISNTTVNGVQRITPQGKAVEIIAHVDPHTSGNKYGLNLLVANGSEEVTRLYYNAVTKQVILDKSNSSLSSHNEENVLLAGNYDENAFGKPHKFHVFVDHSIIDVFINDAAAFSVRVYPTLTHSSHIELFSEGNTNFTSVEVYSLALDAVPVSVSSVSLNKTSANVPLTTTLALEATINPANATNKSVTWSSSNPSVATVSSAGVVTPVALGTATITVTTNDGGHTATCNVTVTQAPDYLVYDFESGDLSGWTVLHGTAFTNGDVTSDNDWGWGGPFGQQGTYHYWGAKNGGDSRTGAMRTDNFFLGGDGIIKFMIGGGFDINSVYIALVRKSDDVELMKATGDNNDSEAYVEKQFDARDYLGVECYIKVVDNHTGGWGHINLDNLRIPVQAHVAVTGVTVNPVSVSLMPGQTVNLSAEVAPGNASNKNVSWSSSNTSVATVDNTGKVTAVAQGNATITVTTQEGNFTAQASIAVGAQDYLVYDFEAGDLSGWTVLHGNAFTNGDVTSDTNWGWGGPFGHQGTYHFWGHKNGNDARTGAMRTQDFYLGGDGIITFLVGGGFDINTLYIALVRSSDDVELMKATGDNNDSEVYVQKQFNASQYVGTKCYIKVVDNHTGGWGHINLDNLRIPVQEYLVYDFESGDLSGWNIISGNAFTNGDVTSDTNWGWGGPFGHQGTYHFWGHKNGNDARTGEMRSQDFMLSGNGVITFLIGGGFDINNLYIALVRKSDGMELMKATGDNNDSEAYVQKQFNASSYVGTVCYIKVVDNHTGGWGHINLDHIVIPVNNSALRMIANDEDEIAKAKAAQAENETEAVKEKAYASELVLYPNPSEKYFYIRTEEELKKANIEVVDITGRSVKGVELTQISQNLWQLNHNLPAGLYYLRVMKGSEMKFKKMIVK